MKIGQTFKCKIMQNLKKKHIWNKSGEIFYYYDGTQVNNRKHK